MNTPSEEPTPNDQVTKGSEWEQAHDRLHEELTERPARRPLASEGEEQVRPQTRTRPQRGSRRKMLAKGMGVAVVASVGAGALLELSSGAALAVSTPKPGVFASSVAGTPAVKSTGTNGADGVDASSDNGTGVSATSSSGTGLVATSSTGLAAHFVGGNVTMDKNLTVTGALSTGTLSSGAGALASSVSGTPAVKATGSNGAGGVDASSDSGIGVSGTGANAGVLGSSSSGVGVSGSSISGFGVLGSSSSGDGVTGRSDSTASFVAGVHGQNLLGGFAGWFDGDVHVVGNLSATGMKPFVQAHPTDPGQEIVYVALEGGEAGTYVRGTAQLQSGKAVIALPEHFELVTASEGLSVQLTPRGEWLQLYVVELDTAQLVVREAQGKSGAFDYFICGVRRGYEQHEVIRTRR